MDRFLSYQRKLEYGLERWQVGFKWGALFGYVFGFTIGFLTCWAISGWAD
jgi:hypothetical protein